jgi:hypothetical protein
VTSDAKLHGVIDNSRGYCHLANVSVTIFAVYPFADVRGVVESDVRFLYPTPDALPWNILSLVVVILHFPDLGVLSERRRMTTPAGPNIGNRGYGATSNSKVTVHAFDLNFINVDLMNESDRLTAFGQVPEEMRYRLGE